jgi:hypothetical protein
MKRNKKAAAESAAPGKLMSLDTGVKLLAAVVGVATLGFGIYQYRTRFQGEQYRTKQDLYARAMKSTTDFANASSQSEADEAKKAFWGLYYGQLSSYENEEVKTAMQTFGGAVKSWEQTNDPSDFTPPSEFEYFPDGPGKPSVSFNDLSYRLTQACRRDLGIQ